MFVSHFLNFSFGPPFFSFGWFLNHLVGLEEVNRDIVSFSVLDVIDHIIPTSVWYLLFIVFKVSVVHPYNYWELDGIDCKDKEAY